MLEWEREITVRLLDKESLRWVIPYLCKAEADSPRKSQFDPITSVTVICLTCPLHLCLTEVGAILFSGRATLVYPYNLMSEEHKQFLRDCLARPEEWTVVNDAVVFMRSSEPVLLDAGAVLEVICRNVFDSKVHIDDSTRMATCNIVLQRVQGYVPIKQNVQRTLNAWLQARLDERQQALTNTNPVTRSVFEDEEWG